MSFSIEWEAEYKARNGAEGMEARLSKLLRDFVGNLLIGQRVLEFGAGCGANVKHLRSAGADYWGIEGSRAAVDKIEECFPEISGRVWCGDFTKPHPFGGDFDVVIDRASIAHNDVEGIEAAVSNAWESLKPGGLFISSDWFSIRHSEYGQAERVAADTFTDYSDGQFLGIGCVHFSSESELATLFRRFQWLLLNERITRRPAPDFVQPSANNPPWISSRFDGSNYQSAVWDIVVRKPR